MAEQLTHEAFAECLQTRFQVQVAPDQIVELELTHVSEFKVSPRQEQFALVFRGPNEVFLGQGTRSLDHYQMGQFLLFLVPISQDDQGFCYEAVFNRVREQAETAG